MIKKVKDIAFSVLFVLMGQEGEEEVLVIKIREKKRLKIISLSLRIIRYIYMNFFIKLKTATLH